MHSLNKILTYLAIISLIKAEDIKTKMEKDQIVPDVIDKSPELILNVTYAENITVNLGSELTPTQVKELPVVKFDFKPDVYYMLAMVDPDAPSRENATWREVNHWLVGNVKNGDFEKAETITEYLGSGPPKGTGLHRYVFLMFEQKEKLTFDEPRTEKFSRAHRLNFNLRKFVKKYDLGDAVAGNYYMAQWDPYVDERNKLIEKKN